MAGGRTKGQIDAAVALMSDEEKRKVKVETSANWPPRTPPLYGEGYFFFQGPTPLTGKQADLPGFFDELAGTPARFKELNIIQKGVIGSAAILSLVLLVIVLIPTAPSPTYVAEAVAK